MCFENTIKRWLKPEKIIVSIRGRFGMGKIH